MATGRQGIGKQGSGDGWAQGPSGQPVWGRFGAAGLFLIADGAVLLQHRAPWTNMGGTWGIPGGARDAGESAQAAALRETVEECGIDSREVTVVAQEVTAGPGPSGWTYTTVIATAPRQLETQANAESVELRWVPLTQLWAGTTGLDLLEPFAQALPRLREICR
ncbi:NUDIX hydrolase [Corynebacterium lizhenjunii]|uniref:NUDIX hydrolase n=1 Tax=Corynebacterium lizhenjunii TaxID=2709394 RepID=A0A7T0KFC7_9CORY|nr:NUDIX hydrolase [Corynebacterium lizhenjunii]QPK78934.1 NUDIX hydrolase [Corynebacterium lizhenjunii]